MNTDGSRNLKLNKLILTPIGLWPLRHPILKFILVLNSYGLFLSIMFVQIAAIVKSKFDMFTLISNLSCSLQLSVGIIKYITFHVKSREIQWMRDQQISDWNSFKREKEIVNILKKYGKSARFYTLAITISAYLLLIFCLGVQFLPTIRNLKVSTNASQWMPMAPGEYFVDRQKYIIPIFVHSALAYFVILSSVVGTESSSLIYLFHICALFKTAGFFLESAVDDAVLQASPSTKSNVIRARLGHAIQIHMRAIELADVLWSTFISSYFILTWLGVISLGLNLFQLCHAINFALDTKEIIITLTMCMSPATYMFITTYFGQQMKDHSAEVFSSACESRWYEAPPQIRKLFLPILLRSSKEVIFTSGGMFVISLEGFTALMNMSVSYFMVLHSTQ